MGGTTGGPKTLSGPDIVSGDNLLADIPKNPIDPTPVPMPNPIPIQVPLLEDGVGRGQANRPQDVWAAKGLMDAPTTQAGPAIDHGVATAQKLLGAKSIDGFSRSGGETENLVRTALQNGQVKLPAGGLTAAPTVAITGPRSATQTAASSPAIFDAFRPGQGQTDQIRTARKLQDAANRLASPKPPVARTMELRDEARQDPFIRDSEEQNRKRFENGTFLGKTGNADLNDKLLTLKDGQAVNLSDHWEVDFPKSKSDDLKASVEKGQRALIHPDRFLATGSMQMKSSSDVVARRGGNTIHIKSTVLHKADDT